MALLDLALETSTSVEGLRAIGAGALGVVLLYFLASRIRSSADPSVNYSASSDGGSASFLLSGAWLTAALAVGIAVLAWPIVSRSTGIQALLALAVVGHYAIEKREAME